MKKTDFTYSIKPIGIQMVECLLKNKKSGITYGVVVQANALPPEDWCYNQFVTRCKEFFVDLPSVFEAEWLITYDI